MSIPLRRCWWGPLVCIAIHPTYLTRRHPFSPPVYIPYPAIKKQAELLDAVAAHPTCVQRQQSFLRGVGTGEQLPAAPTPDSARRRVELERLAETNPVVRSKSQRNVAQVLVRTHFVSCACRGRGNVVCGGRGGTVWVWSPLSFCAPESSLAASGFEGKYAGTV